MLQAAIPDLNYKLVNALAVSPRTSGRSNSDRIW